MSRRGLLGLIAFGNQLRANRARRRRVRQVGGAVAALITLLTATIMVRPAPRLVWNASASAPIGLYRVSPGTRPKTGDTVIAWAPSPWRALAARRHYLPFNVPLVKYVAAVPGQRICAHGGDIYVAGLWVATRRARDGQGRTMPWWDGCRTLQDGDYLLLIPGVAASFDGRYFGTTQASDIIGTAQLLWPR